MSDLGSVFPQRGGPAAAPDWMTTDTGSVVSLLEMLGGVPPQPTPERAAPPAPPPPIEEPPAAPAAEEDQAIPPHVQAQLEEIEAAVQAQGQAFAEAALSLTSARQVALAQAEEQLLDLALEIAGAIVEDQIERRPELHGALVKRALLALDGPETAVLKASPDAFALLVEQLGEARTTFEGVSVQLVEAPELSGFGCVAETPKSRADGTLAERLREVRRGIDQARQTEEAE